MTLETPPESASEVPRPHPLVAKRCTARWAYIGAGLLCTTFGFVGLAVPGWPTTIFMILALYCFKRSSPRLEKWLLSNRIIGSTLRNWDETRSMTIEAKRIAILAIWVTISISVLVTQKTAVKVLLPCIAIALTVFLLRVKTTPKT